MKNARRNVGDSASRLAKTLGKEFGGCWKKDKSGNLKAKVGCWNVDYNPTYGGAMITEVVNVGGGITSPFGFKRRKPEDFIDSVNMAITAIEIDRKQRKR